MRRILIINLTRMGDLVQTAPLIQTIKKENPKNFVAMLVNEPFKEVCSYFDGLDKIISFDLQKFCYELQDDGISIVDSYFKITSLIEKINETGFDEIINLTSNMVGGRLSTLINGNVVAGFTLGQKGQRIYRHPWWNYFMSILLHRGLNQFNLVDIFTRCGNVYPSGIKPAIDIPARYEEEILKKFALPSLDGKFVVGFQLGASEDNKRWHEEGFYELARKILEWEDAVIFVFGSEKEKPLSQKLLSLKSPNIIDFMGKTTVFELASLIKLSDALVTNDTGPMHIGVGVGTTVICLSLGPVYYKETAPYTENGFIIQPDLPCAPCDFNCNCPNEICKEMIKPEHVLSLLAFLKTGDEIKEEVFDTSILIKAEFDDDDYIEFFPFFKRTPAPKDIFGIILKETYKACLDKKPFKIADILNILTNKTASHFLPPESAVLERLFGLTQKLYEFNKNSQAAIAVIEGMILEQTPEKLRKGISNLGAFNNAIFAIGKREPFLLPLTTSLQFRLESINSDDINEILAEYKDAYIRHKEMVSNIREIIEKIREQK